MIEIKTSILITVLIISFIGGAFSVKLWYKNKIEMFKYYKDLYETLKQQ